MNILPGIFQRNKPNKNAKTESLARHFLRVTSPFVNDLFQISKADADKAIEAQTECTFFQFKTITGRRCAIKFRHIQAIELFETSSEIVSSNQICGVLIYLDGRTEVMDVEPYSSEQVSEFFKSLEAGADCAALGDWHFNTSEIVIAVASETI